MRQEKKDIYAHLYLFFIVFYSSSRGKKHAINANAFVHVNNVVHHLIILIQLELQPVCLPFHQHHHHQTNLHECMHGMNKKRGENDNDFLLQRQKASQTVLLLLLLRCFLFIHYITMMILLYHYNVYIYNIKISQISSFMSRTLRFFILMSLATKINHRMQEQKVCA